MRNRFGLGIVLATVLASFAYAQPFTYQGMLKQNGNPVNGTLSMTFRLYDALTGGNQAGSIITQNVAVQNGLFTVSLDFGNVWNGSDRYLEIAVGSTVLSPRVKINPVPYASFAQRPWQTSGSNIFYTAGNVGIGTDSPAARLSLGGGDANTKLALWQGGTAADVMGFGIAPGQFRLHLHHPGNRFSFLNAPNGTEIFTIYGNGDLKLADDRSISGLDQLVGYNDLRLYGDETGGPDLFIAANGNVGIGRSIPTERLHVNGNIRLADDSSIFGLDKLVGYNDLGLTVHPHSVALLYITRDGKVGINNGDPQAQLHVNGSAFLTGGLGHHTLQIIPGQLFGANTENFPSATLEMLGSGILGIWDNLQVDGHLLVRNNWLSVGGGGNPYGDWRVVAKAVEDSPGAWVGVLETRGANGSLNVRLSYPDVGGTPYFNNGSVSVRDQNGDMKVSIYVDQNGDGVVRATWKLFVVPDPDDPTRDIWYGCIEGPELAMYVRGTARLVNGRAQIELPDHFRKLADEQGMTVQLTPRSGESKGLAAVRVSLDGIEVVELLNGRGNYAFDWEVKAVRKEHRDFRVYRPWDEVMMGGDDPAEAWEARLKSIQARQERQPSFNVKP